MQSDPCARKHRGNPASTEAFERVDSADDCALALRIITRLGECTSKDIMREMQRAGRHVTGLNQFSGRLTTLKGRGLIEETGARRDGCAVLRRRYPEAAEPDADPATGQYLLIGGQRS